MTDKELDELFRNTFSGHQVPVPEEMWQRVNPQKEKKRRIIFWWSSGLGIAALLLVGVFVWWNTTPSTPAKSSNIAGAGTSHESGKSQSSIHMNDSAGQIEKQAEASSRNTKMPDVIMLPATDKKLFTAKKESRYRRNIIPADSYNKYHLCEHNNTGKQPDELSEIYSQKETKPSDRTRDEKAVGNTLSTDSLSVSSTISGTADSGLIAQTNAIGKPDSAAADANTSAIQVHLPKSRKTSLELSVAGFAGDRDIYGVKKEVPAFAITLNEPRAKATLQGYSLNVRIEKPVGQHWSLKTGLQFLQARQSVTYNAESVSRYSVVNAFGLGADTTQFTQISLHRPVTKSSYNSFHVPLLLSFHTDIKKLSIGATGGVLFNLFSWYKGEVPDGSYMRELTAKEAFRRNLGSSLYLGLPVAKSFGNWQAFIEPQLQYSLSSITQSKASFKQKMTYYGVGIGIKKALKK